MLIRAKFSKLKPVRYISHLELMDTFRRSLRRADIPVDFTEGYNPHIKLSLCQPLSVGMVGKAEYLDIFLKEKIDRIIFLNTINEKLPGGIEVLDAKYIPEEAKSLQAVINSAVYLLDLKIDRNIDEKKFIKDFYNREEIIITRFRRNKKNRKLDLKKMIYNIEVEDRGKWKFTVSAGSSGNVRPSELSRALAERYSEIKKIPLIKIERIGMFVKKGENFYQPYAKEIVGK